MTKERGNSRKGRNIKGAAWKGNVWKKEIWKKEIWKYLFMILLCLTANVTSVYARPGAVQEPGTDDLLYLTRKLEQAEVPETPEETYWDRKGNQFELERYEVKEIPEHMADRHMEKQVVYPAVEGAEGFPQSIGVQEELSGGPADGELFIRDARITKEEWQDGFEAPVLFHAYGADEYQAGSIVIDGSDVLASAVSAQEEILGIMGLSAGEYRILSMEWAGEPFEDDEGQMCRQAMARGQKLVRDYEVTYEGTVSLKEPVSYELEMVYRPVRPSQIWVDEEQPDVYETDQGPGTARPSRESPLWYWVRSGFVITVGAGLVGIGVGILILSAGWLKKRRRERQERCLPEIHG